MEAFSAIRAAASILTFIEFSCKLVSRSYEIHSSAKGQTESTEELRLSTDRIRALCRNIARPVSHQQIAWVEGTRHETQAALYDSIEAIGHDCVRIGDELSNALTSITAKPHNFRSSVRTALRVVLRKHSILELERRLERCKQDLLLTLVSSLVNETSVMHETVQSLSMQDLESSADGEKGLDVQHRELMSDLHLWKAGKQHSQAVSEVLPSKLEVFASSGLHGTRNRAVLDSLNFSHRPLRFNMIPNIHERTFEWIFESEHAGKSLMFREFLQTSSDIFWITGAPGSGKSTMMKYLCQEERTRELLQCWAEDCELVIARYFFWHAGHEMEKSQEGLLRALLFDILSQCPQSIAVAFPSRYKLWSWYSPEPWTIEELGAAFTALAGDPSVDKKFCFFIDGLDEYRGNPRDIVDIIHKLSTLSGVKVCVASRDRNYFEAVYGQDPTSRLAIHEHNQEDIQRFVQEELEENSLFQREEFADPRYFEAVQQIVKKSQGVFLWVRLVVNQLIDSLPDFDTLETFQKKIAAFPPDLDVFFERMLAEQDPAHHHEGAKILLMILSTDRQLPLTIFLPILEGFQKPNEMTVDPDMPISRLRTRLKARCKDLVSVQNGFESPYDTFYGALSVTFLHRTVTDYLRQDAVLQLLLTRAGTQFNSAKEIWLGYTATHVIGGSLISKEHLEPFSIWYDLLVEQLYWVEILSKSKTADEPWLKWLGQLDSLSELGKAWSIRPDVEPEFWQLGYALLHHTRGYATAIWKKFHMSQNLPEGLNCAGELIKAGCMLASCTGARMNDFSRGDTVVYQNSRNE